MYPENEHGDQPIDIPITGELDLHTFSPKEIREVIDAYLEACRQRHIHQVRIIHGKGTGTLRETTHSLLRRRSDVESFHLGNETSGGWGATLVTLRH